LAFFFVELVLIGNSFEDSRLTKWCFDFLIRISAHDNVFGEVVLPFTLGEIDFS